MSRIVFLVRRSQAETNAMSTESFYRDLVPFSDFVTLSDDRHYKKLPGDWFVVITDVRGSTKAIEQGRYQQVNMLGAASVAVLGTLWRDNGVPFIFGGDGASILVPPTRIADVTRELLKLRNLALANYDLELRVGVVPMKDVADEGLTIWVAKFAAGEAKPIAFMKGGGLAWADTAIKSKTEKYGLVDGSLEALGEVKDLSCRWQPIPSGKGKVLSILVRSVSGEVQVFEKVLTHLTQELDGDLSLSNPVNLRKMTYKSFWDTARSEFRLHSRHVTRDYLVRLLWSLFSVWSFKGQRETLFNAKKYTQSLPAHSDFRKFDDMLRLVIDCTPKQVERIRTYLEALYLSGEIHYGIHESAHAIMTCLVGSTNDGDHIHFIDGGAGGYAMAAKALKEQIAMASSKGAAV